jgi:undecaprenyl-phosphate 4-deoxy-4-formamido-L-arabinose transferase
MNRLRERITHIRITDQGNMLRAYGRNVIDLVNQCAEVNTFVPALAYTFARNPAEVVVEHEERAAGASKYSFYSLVRLNFDLVTGFSLVPLQMFSMLGMALSGASGLLVLVLLTRRLLLGAEAEGAFTLFALLFFLMGVILFGIGLLGEYIGRIYQQVRARPRYVVQTILEAPAPGARRQVADAANAAAILPQEQRGVGR